MEEESVDVLGTTASGETALDLAERGKHREVTRYLLPRIIDRQMQTASEARPSASIRRTRSISLADPHTSQRYIPSKLTDPLQRRSAHFNRFSTCGEEQPIYSEVFVPSNNNNINQIPNSSM